MLTMFRPTLMPLLALCMLFTLPAKAQTTCAECPMPTAQDLPIQVDPGFPVTPDFLIMVKKAMIDRNLLTNMENILARRTNENSREMLDQVLMIDSPQHHDLKAAPYRYTIAAKVEAAQNRARVLGEMLATDLNNDGQITQPELTDALSLSRANYVAEAFFTGDKDGDSVLNADELRAAAVASVALVMGNRAAYRNFSEVLDFDADGTLTHEEYQRGLVAMGFPTP